MRNKEFGHEPRRRKIGLLGGSFNPAHEGHGEIAQRALSACHLDEIWWLVSPQNPLKRQDDMDGYAERVASVHRLIGDHPKMKIKHIEQEIGTAYTAETIRYLLSRFHDCAFLWIMGADNLLQIHQWRDWQWIFRAVPIVILARPGYNDSVMRAKAAKLFARYRIPEQAARILVKKKAPAWLFLHGRLNPISASLIRSSRKPRLFPIG